MMFERDEEEIRRLVDYVIAHFLFMLLINLNRFWYCFYNVVITLRYTKNNYKIK